MTEENKNVGQPPAETKVRQPDLKNTDHKCSICASEERPASIELKRIIEAPEARYEAINVCHVCSAKGAELIWEEYDKRISASKKNK